MTVVMDTLLEKSLVEIISKWAEPDLTKRTW